MEISKIWEAWNARMIERTGKKMPGTIEDYSSVSFELWEMLLTQEVPV